MACQLEMEYSAMSETLVRALAKSLTSDIRARTPTVLTTAPARVNVTPTRDSAPVTRVLSSTLALAVNSVIVLLAATTLPVNATGTTGNASANLATPVRALFFLCRLCCSFLLVQLPLLLCRLLNDIILDKMQCLNLDVCR